MAQDAACVLVLRFLVVSPFVHRNTQSQHNKTPGSLRFLDRLADNASGPPHLYPKSFLGRKDISSDLFEFDFESFCHGPHLWVRCILHRV